MTNITQILVIKNAIILNGKISVLEIYIIVNTKFLIKKETYVNISYFPYILKSINSRIINLFVFNIFNLVVHTYSLKTRINSSIPSARLSLVTTIKYSPISFCINV